MGPGGFFPTNPDLANILGDTDFDFENFHFFIFWFPDFQTGPGLGLGRAWAGLGRAGPGLGRAGPVLDRGLGCGCTPARP